MLLLDVQVDIDPTEDDRLNEWYHAHVPRLLSVEGYDSGRRYKSITPGPRYLALYEIRHERHLPSLLGNDRSLRNLLTLSEWARWDHDLVPHMSHCKTNVYRPRDDLSLPLVRGAAAIVTVRLDDVGGDREHTREIVGAAMNEFVPVAPEVLGARLLERAGHPAIEWLGTAPELLLLVECSGTAAARGIARGEGTARAFMKALEAVGNRQPDATAYTMIARHWPHWRDFSHAM